MSDSNMKLVESLLAAANRTILGKPDETRLILCGILARGHILIEDQPGMGKTTLVKTFAKLLGLKMNRIQFTSDLLPSDILGTTFFDSREAQFMFRPGPIFSELVLADELNRATPRTQSACLQALEEHQVTIEGTTHSLPNPFLFIATQNPKQSVGTFPLPHSQLDRFMMKLKLGYPSQKAEAQILREHHSETSASHKIDSLAPIMNVQTLLQIQSEIDQIKVSEPILEYILKLLHSTRENGSLGLSPRAGIDLIKSAKAWAFLEGRDYVLPEDVQHTFPVIAIHRMHLEETHAHAFIQDLLEKTSVT